MSATVFLATDYMESGEIFPFLKLQLLRMADPAGYTGAPSYKSDPLDKVLEWADPRWPEVARNLTADQRSALRPLTIGELRTAYPEVIEFGAHSHTHCILRNESDQRRQEEIRLSVEKVREWTGGAARLFSYPNGEPGDFGEIDKQALRASRVEAAVSGIGGANDRHTELLELKRYPVGIYHDEDGFRAEVTGFRTAVLAASRGLAS